MRRDRARGRRWPAPARWRRRRSRAAGTTPPPVECLRLEGPRRPVGFGAHVLDQGHARLSAARAAAASPGGRSKASRWPRCRRAERRLRADRAHCRRWPRRVGGVPWGVVPLSPRTRGEIVLARPGPTTAAARSRARSASPPPTDRAGCPNTPVGVRVYLGGDGWHVTARPAGSGAALDTTGGVASLLPDVAGDWRLADGGGRTLALRSGRYDETPLDCGRAGCHPAITDAVAASPMTTVFARLMDATPRPAGYPGCALACHATGEPGAHDGGFSHVASELGAGGRSRSPLGRAAARPAPAGRRRLPRLPRAGRDSRKRRRAGACCAPTSAPSATTRRRATGTSWPGAQSAMARADQDPRARSERACARCHTTAGFPRGRRPARTARRSTGARPTVPVRSGSRCSACHAVHDPRRPDGTARLLRSIAGAGAARGRAAERLPPLPHARCRRRAPERLGGGHLARSRRPGSGDGSAADRRRAPRGDRRRLRRLPPRRPRQSSSAAPATPFARRRPSARRAIRRARRRRPTCARAPSSCGVACRPENPARPAHAGDARVDRRTPRGRAIWDLLLVLEDPAAAAHNARYARALLDAAESVLQAGDTRRTPR